MRDETDRSMLLAYAQNDAIDSLTTGGVGYWKTGPYDNPAAPLTAEGNDLENWLSDIPTATEWETYRDAYNEALQAAIKVCQAAEIKRGWSELGTLNEAIDAIVNTIKNLQNLT